MSGRTVVVSMGQVRHLVPMKDCIRLQEDVFRLSASGRAWEGASAWTLPDAVPMAHPRAAKMMLGGIEPDWWGIKTLAHSDGTPQTKRRMQILSLFHAESLLPAALIEANYLGYLRTGAASAVATRHLARPDARVLGVLGTGAVVRFAVCAHVALGWPIERIVLYSPSAERREQYAHELRDRHGLAVEAVEDVDEAVRRAEILISGTGAGRPAFDPQLLLPGAHVNAMGHRAELDHRIFEIARTIADDRANAIANGKLSVAIRAGAATADVIAASLGEVVAGERPGRSSERDITLFDSSGVTFQDIAVGIHVWRLARERGIGERVELDTDADMW
ncbi:MAG: ornithine cyclodeaminase family protein [Solirubrobacteraceae bacterium]|nr:ornithine cyclodeaminase family protein [Solirubrobacteraceae bacterium]